MRKRLDQCQQLGDGPWVKTAEELLTLVEAPYKTSSPLVAHHDLLLSYHTSPEVSRLAREWDDVRAMAIILLARPTKITGHGVGATSIGIPYAPDVCDPARVRHTLSVLWAILNADRATVLAS